VAVDVYEAWGYYVSLGVYPPLRPLPPQPPDGLDPVPDYADIGPESWVP